ncbi:YigZ family protein [Dyadobacter sp. LHD-138]|uniref:IMPACT family protein n=1 Tax=Dyadobacter sp. LHD-138 TaxID=3071413 RepID=UPI0027E1FDA7|nr:YigZ family protein [Dyadobacter sp. LHD-138]MDQ6480368.1 YigZ family protein [Dyadobacter sp. LHD-138]
MLFEDTYRTVAEPVEGFFKDKGSKFISFVFPISSENEAKSHLLALREIHPRANHHVYAYRLGMDRMQYRLSDDGEPSGSSGRSILNTLYSKEITNVLVIVVRYFGGTLLGIPGLINAYRSATEDALENAEIVVKHLFSLYKLSFSYIQMNDVMRIVKELELPVSEQLFEMECTLVVEVRNTLLERFMTRVEKVEDLKVELV